MTIYRKKGNVIAPKPPTLQQVQENPMIEGAKPSFVRIAQSKMMMELSEMSNSLDIENKVIKLSGGQNISLQIIANLAAQGNNDKMIAMILGMSDRNFRYLKKAHPEIEEAVLKGRGLLSSRLVHVAMQKIDEEKDTGNKLLMTMMTEFAGIGGKTSVKIEHSISDEDRETNKNQEIERHKSIMSKIFDEKEVKEAIDADFEEVDKGEE